MHILKEGAIFGELLLSEEKRAFTAVAGTDALVTVLPKGGLVELLSAIPTVSRNFIRLLSKRLAKVEMEFGDFGHTWSYNRLAKILLRLCEEHGKETPAGIVIPLRLTHEDLANLIGTTRETVTTQMIRFRRMGLVKRQDHLLVVNKPRLGGVRPRLARPRGIHSPRKPVPKETGGWRRASLRRAFPTGDAPVRAASRRRTRDARSIRPARRFAGLA